MFECFLFLTCQCITSITVLQTGGFSLNKLPVILRSKPRAAETTLNQTERMANTWNSLARYLFSSQWKEERVLWDVCFLTASLQGTTDELRCLLWGLRSINTSAFGYPCWNAVVNIGLFACLMWKVFPSFELIFFFSKYLFWEWRRRSSAFEWVWFLQCSKGISLLESQGDFTRKSSVCLNSGT